MMPPTRSHGWASAASTQQQGEKRKCGAFDDIVEEIDQSPPRDQVVPSQNRASASSNPLFDSPLRAVANPEMAPIVIDAVQQWILNVKREQALGKIDPLGLLSGLGCCMESKEATMESPFDGKRAGELEMQVVEAARTISLHLDYHVLEKALVATVVAKDFVQARRLIDELELLCKFLAVADVEVGCLGPSAEPSETQAVGSPQHVDRRRFDADAARGSDLMEDVERPRLDADAARGSAVTEDVEDTLTAMMEMGAEETQPALCGQ